jgi:glycosyltransferase involved in cell wall biosynthesis
MRLVRRRDYDVIDAWLYHAYVLAGLTRPLTRVPVLVAGRRSLSDYKEAFGWLPRLLDRMAYRAADILVANASAVALDVTRREAVDPGRIRIIRNGVDPAKPLTVAARVAVRRRWNATDDEIVIGCVSNYKSGKGLELLLSVAAIVCRECPVARFVLIGEGPLRGRLAEGVADHGVVGRVVLHGAEPDAREILSALDIYVQPSDSEGLPNVVLEAAAAGLPIVATDAGGSREIVEDGTSGLIVPVGDALALARGLIQLAEDRAARDAMGQAARAKVAREFTNDRFVREFGALYHELLATKGRR